MKAWSREHVHLAKTVADVRDRLRLLDWSRLDAETARILTSAIRSLNHGLKARQYRSNRVEVEHKTSV